MITTIDTTYSQRNLLPSFDETQAKSIQKKGWSFSYVYNFSEIRDIYLALQQIRTANLSQFTLFCKQLKLPFVKTKWNKRRILEHLNALKNFELIDSFNGYFEVKKKVFENAKIGDDLTDFDLKVFYDIYFSYFRFKEIFVWFIDPEVEDRENYIVNISESEILNNSKAIFTYSEKSRFTDSFFFELKNNPLIFNIDRNSGQDLMRFWDVFIKWGTSLGVLEKFNLRNLNIKTISGKGISCTYLINNSNKNFNLMDYINNRFTDKYVYLPALVLDIAINLRLKIDDIHQSIIEQYKLYKEFLSFERTSEIFVKKLDIVAGDKILFLKYNDSYISHIIIRK